MKLVIDISEPIYKAVMNFDGKHDVLIDRECLYESIKNGSPLPNEKRILADDYLKTEKK